MVGARAIRITEICEPAKCRTDSGCALLLALVCTARHRETIEDMLNAGRMLLQLSHLAVRFVCLRRFCLPVVSHRAIFVSHSGSRLVD